MYIGSDSVLLSGAGGRHSDVTSGASTSCVLSNSSTNHTTEEEEE